VSAGKYWRNLTLTFSAIGLIGWLVPSEAAVQLQRVRISYSAPSTSIAFKVAMDQGFYKAEGLDVELIHINPRLAPVALANGDIDSTTTFNNTLHAIVQGFPLKFVFVSVRKGAYFLMARPELKRIQDLTNKKIGVTQSDFRRPCHRSRNAAHKKHEPGHCHFSWPR
jgi:ABC-type nitrate/sulfonate/bicarbonate transport system substrate-binding protein